MKKRFPIKWFIISFAVVMGFSILMLVIQMIQVGGPQDYYIFADISECDNLSLIADDEAVISRISSENDKKLKGNEYEAFWGAEYSSPELRFKIFAYEFADADAAKEYFYNNTGKDVGFNTTFSMSCGGIRGSLQLICIDGSNAYCVYSTAKDHQELIALLKECFSVSIMEKHKSEQK